MKNWDEIRIAYHVARLGTLSAAAEYLGVHHATAIRHIDALEGRLGSKLFHRHARGYTATRAGRDLMGVAAATEEQFSQLARRLQGQKESISGELIVTSLSGLSPLFLPIFVAFQNRYPDVRLSHVGDDRPLRLEYGEAHIALRAGAKPQGLDNVVQHLMDFPMGLFAHKDYVARYGRLKSDEQAKDHRFALRADRKAKVGPPFLEWVRRYVPDEAVVFESQQMRNVEDAIKAGAGIGFLSLWSGDADPNLVQMMAPRVEWCSTLWIVTHVDLHRTAKVQAFSQALKAGIQKLNFN